ncbi:MAG: hypothetical protein ABEH38_09725 [Flavobacteriales bacterium]
MDHQFKVPVPENMLSNFIAYHFIRRLSVDPYREDHGQEPDDREEMRTLLLNLLIITRFWEQIRLYRQHRTVSEEMKGEVRTWIILYRHFTKGSPINEDLDDVVHDHLDEMRFDPREDDSDPFLQGTDGTVLSFLSFRELMEALRLHEDQCRFEWMMVYHSQIASGAYYFDEAFRDLRASVSVAERKRWKPFLMEWYLARAADDRITQVDGSYNFDRPTEGDRDRELKFPFRLRDGLKKDLRTGREMVREELNAVLRRWATIHPRSYIPFLRLWMEDLEHLLDMDRPEVLMLLELEKVEVTKHRGQSSSEELDWEVDGREFYNWIMTNMIHPDALIRSLRSLINDKKGGHDPLPPSHLVPES